MRLPAKKNLGIVLLIAGILMSSHTLPYEQSKLDQTPGPKRESATLTPDLSEIIPSATKLAGRLAALENKTAVVLDISEIERKFAVIEANLQDPASQLLRLKDSKQTRLNKFILLGEAFEEEGALFGEISVALINAIRKLNNWRKEWLREKKRWNE